MRSSHVMEGMVRRNTYLPSCFTVEVEANIYYPQKGSGTSYYGTSNYPHDNHMIAIA